MLLKRSSQRNVIMPSSYSAFAYPHFVVWSDNLPFCSTTDTSEPSLSYPPWLLNMNRNVAEKRFVQPCAAHAPRIRARRLYSAPLFRLCSY